ncbi:MAG: aspartate/glutamate racemase family protein [Erysipelotrichaceae bacterium]
MNKRIGMIDSGLGGISMLKACVDAYPNYDYVFIGDQLNAPYGDLSVEDIYKNVQGMLHFLQAAQVYEVIVACNTVCATILDKLVEEYPNMIFHGIIDPTARLLDEEHKHVLVLATCATTSTHRYQQAIKFYHPSIKVDEVAAQKLVPLVEAGAKESSKLLALHELIDPYLDHIDAILLGCTHYPLLINEIKCITDVKLYDSNKAILATLDFKHSDEIGSVQVYTSASPAIMHQQLLDIMNKDYDVQKFIAKP